MGRLGQWERSLRYLKVAGYIGDMAQPEERMVLYRGAHMREHRLGICWSSDQKLRPVVRAPPATARIALILRPQAHKLRITYQRLFAACSGRGGCIAGEKRLGADSPPDDEHHPEQGIEPRCRAASFLMGVRSRHPQCPRSSG